MRNAARAPRLDQDPQDREARGHRRIDVERRGVCAQHVDGGNTQGGDGDCTQDGPDPLRSEQCGEWRDQREPADDLKRLELRDSTRRGRVEGRPHDGGVPRRHAERAERENGGAAVQPVADREQARQRGEHGRRERVNDDHPAAAISMVRNTTNRAGILRRKGSTGNAAVRSLAMTGGPPARFE